MFILRIGTCYKLVSFSKGAVFGLDWHQFFLSFDCFGLFAGANLEAGLELFVLQGPCQLRRL